VKEYGMSNIVKRIALMCVLVILASAAWGSPFRSITTVEWEQYSAYYEGGTQGYRVHEVGIYRLNDGWSIVGKAEWEKLPFQESVKAMGGVVFTLLSYSYMETSYGISVTDGDAIAHHVFIDYNYERQNYLLSAGATAELSEKENTIIPSVAGLWRSFSPLELWGKYFTAFSSTKGFDHSFWGELRYDVSTPLRLKAGGTVGTYHLTNVSPQEIEYSVLGGMTYRHSDQIHATLQVEYLNRQKYYRTVSSNFILDIRL
jgi:hypothetical protein